MLIKAHREENADPLGVGTPQEYVNFLSALIFMFFFD